MEKPRQFKLDSGFMSPQLLRDISRRPVGAIASDDGRFVSLATHSFSVMDVPLSGGSNVMVYISTGGRLVCSYKDELELFEKFEREEYQKEQERKKAQAENKRVANIAFNAALNIPVAWQPAIKPVLSGLTENSAGTGENRRTVVHVMLREDLSDGRIRRRKNSFLCTSDSGSNGRLYDVNFCGEDVGMRVSCKKCLSIAKRWSHEAEMGQ